MELSFPKSLGEIDVPAWVHEHKSHTASAGAVIFLVIAFFPTWLAQLWFLFSTRDFVSVMNEHALTSVMVGSLYAWVSVLIGLALVGFVGIAFFLPQPTLTQALHERGEALRERDAAVRQRDEAVRALREMASRARPDAPRAQGEHSDESHSADRLLGLQKTTVPSRVGHGDWHRMAEKFRGIRDASVRADWTYSATGDSWKICGGVLLANQDCEALCRAAGNMLLASPNVAAVLSPSVRREATPAWRWLRYVQEVSSFQNDLDGDKEDGSYAPIGSIDDLPSISARLCVECSALESVLG